MYSHRERSAWPDGLGYPHLGSRLGGQLKRSLVPLALLLSLCTAAVADCDPSRVDLRGEFGQVSFTVELADDNESRAKGLMFRESLPRFSGMLFVYERPAPARFWMRNTLLPLDMIFLNRNGVVSRVHKMARPHDETIINGGNFVLAVLEINGGLAEKLGITKGAEMRHPAFGAAAKWSCSRP